ncbi:MAG: hypothetical protein K2L34_00845, partial [Muribaculaceae bacterium]|nr:hypothetical protein [Muribaculaceae bacterium]
MIIARQPQIVIVPDFGESANSASMLALRDALDAVIPRRESLLPLPELTNDSIDPTMVEPLKPGNEDALKPDNEDILKHGNEDALKHDNEDSSDEVRGLFSIGLDDCLPLSLMYLLEDRKDFKVRFVSLPEAVDNQCEEIAADQCEDKDSKTGADKLIELSADRIWRELKHVMGSNSL